MKNILSFEKYRLLKESDETTPDEVKTTEDGVEIEKRNSAVVLKEFFKELKSHLIYWFTYGDISKILKADTNDIEQELRGLCCWAIEVDDNSTEKYQWRIKFLEADQEGMVDRIKKVKMSLDVFDFNKEYLIKSKEIIIDVDKISEDFLIRKIKKVKSTIIKEPKNNKDIESFKKGERGDLTDDIY